VMSRGDRGERICRDRLDYDLFFNTVAEVCVRTGWKIHAHTLLDNHFHWLLETPDANLVRGMKWFLGAYSQRFNARHGQHGHVLQGRYKALLVEAGGEGYFETVSTYIHLNPARAGCLSCREAPLSEYEWSSYPMYLAARKDRPKWLSVERVLGNLGIRDDKRGRTDYRRYMADRVAQLHTKAGRNEFRSAWDEVRYGWYVGGDDFRDRLLEQLGRSVEGNQRNSYSGAAIRAHDEAASEKLARSGLKAVGLHASDLELLPKGDDRKCAVAWLVHTRTLASHQWISTRLQMGNISNMTGYVDRIRNAESPARLHLRNAAERVIPI